MKFLKFGKRKLEKFIINIDELTYFYESPTIHILPGNERSYKYKARLLFDSSTSIETNISFDEIKDTILLNSHKFIPFTYRTSGSDKEITVYINVDKIKKVVVSGIVTNIYVDRKTKVPVNDTLEDVYEKLDSYFQF